jgi:hypothetical protein
MYKAFVDFYGTKAGDEPKSLSGLEICDKPTNFYVFIKLLWLHGHVWKPQVPQLWCTFLIKMSLFDVGS